MKKTNIRFVVRAVAISMFITMFTGCASVFNVQVLYEAPQPGFDGKEYVMRLEKEQDPVFGVKDEFPLRGFDTSKVRVKEMMKAMYSQTFKVGYHEPISSPKPIFTSKEINALAPKIAQAFTKLRTGEHLTVRTRAFKRNENGELPWKKSQYVTSVAIKLIPANYLGLGGQTRLVWYFYKVQGYGFEPRKMKGEEFPAVFSKEGDKDSDNSRVSFPIFPIK